MSHTNRRSHSSRTRRLARPGLRFRMVERLQRTRGGNRRHWPQLCLVAAAIAVSLGVSWLAIRTMVAALEGAAANSETTIAPGIRLQRLRVAIKMRPDIAENWREQSDLQLEADPTAALASARMAVKLNPSDWRSWRILGLVEFRLGNTAAARSALQAAAVDDHGFAAHYELANFDLLLGDPGGFWSEMKRALAVAPASSVQAAVDACLRVSDNDPSHLLAILSPRRPQLTVAVAQALLNRGLLATAERVWDGLECPERLFAVCQVGLVSLLDAAVGPGAPKNTGRARNSSGEGQSAAFALRAWNSAVQQGYLAQPRAGVGVVVDGEFQFPWVGFGFGWAPSPAVSLLVVPEAGRSQVVSVRLNGMQVDSEWLFEQLVAVTPGQRYLVRVRDRWLGTRGHGIYIAVRGMDGTAIFGQASMALTPNWTDTRLVFTPAPGTRLIYLACRYERPLGQVPLQGELQVANVSLKREPDGDDL